ncbi:MAG: class I SAM-dependent methyltransferase [Pseudomonadota bacterium]
MIGNFLRRALILAAALAVFPTLIVRPAHADAVKDAVGAPDRPQEERARDNGRKPAAVLGFWGVKPGEKVFELAAGGGYYTDLLSRVVGAQGRVYAQYSEGAWTRAKDMFAKRFAPRGNVEAFIGDFADFTPEAASIDAIMAALIWHHMHYDEAAGEALPDKTKAFLASTLRMLKPGGSLLIIEHEAPAGASRAQSAAWHRAPKQMTIADVTAAGFRFEGASDALANPADNLANYWREALPARDSSQRFVLKFSKPAQ